MGDGDARTTGCLLRKATGMENWPKREGVCVSGGRTG